MGTVDFACHGSAVPSSLCVCLSVRLWLSVVACVIDSPPHPSRSPSLSSPVLPHQQNQRGEVAARSDWTVGKLKEELEKKFPGKIPASLQRLFKGTQLLPSSMTLEEASEVRKSTGGHFLGKFSMERYLVSPFWFVGNRCCFSPKAFQTECCPSV